MSQSQNSAGAIFDAAIEIPKEQRAAFLEKACAGDTPLRQRLEALLRAHEAAESFMDGPALKQLPKTVALALRDQSGQTIGRYKLLQQIGEGGCGMVYMAEQEEPVRRKVALKVIKLGMDTKEIIARFEAERQALALMDHPNIAKVLDAGATDTGRPYFVMELVRGIKITDYCDQNNLSTQERLELFMQICRAIQHAHQKGIIHRDIKPSNILVTMNDGVPLPKVIDFGIAKATQGKLTDQTLFTAFEQFMGTPAYMSPEQAEMSALDIDTRSDIYSLGVLLYELLTGQTPLDAQALLKAGLDAMRRAIREQEPLTPSTRLSTMLEVDLTAVAKRRQTEPPRLIYSMRGDLDWIVMKCLEKDRTRRYETANGLAADVRRHLEDEPVSARPPSNIYKFQKMARRNKLAFAAGAAIAASVLIALGVSHHLLIKERLARQTAGRAETKALAQAQRADHSAAEEMAERRRADTALANTDFLLAQRLLTDGQKAKALAYLARSLSLNPTNEGALLRLSDLLTYSRWMVPTMVLEHDGHISSARFSPDGRRIVTVSGGDTLRVWDAQSGEPLTNFREDGGKIFFADYTPDGKWIRLFPGQTAQVCDAQTGQPLMTPFQQTNGVGYVRLSRDGKRIVTESHDYTARLWDMLTGQPLTPPLPHKPHSGFADLSPDGHWMVTGSADNTALIWDTLDSQSLPRTLPQTAEVSVARFSSDGNRLVTVSGDQTARVWNVLTGQPLTKPLQHTSGVIDAEFSPDGERILTISWSNMVQVWDVKTGLRLTNLLLHTFNLRSPQFSPDGNRIVTILDGNAVWLWDAQTGQPVTEPMEHNDHVTDVQFSPNGERMVTCSGHAARIWEAKTGRPCTEAREREGPVDDSQSSPDGKKRILLGSGHIMRIVDAQTGKLLEEPWEFPVSLVDSAQYSPDGQRIVTAEYGNGLARIWDTQTRQLLAKPLNHPDQEVSYAEFSPTGKWIVTASGNAVRIWDAQSGEPLTGPWSGCSGRFLRSTHFSSDAKRIAVGVDSDILRLWDVPPVSVPWPDWLVPLTEAISGEHFDERGLLEETKMNRGETIERIRQRLNNDAGKDDWTVWGRWLLANPATRTISPFSSVTISEWIERQMEEDSPESLNDLAQYAVAVNNPELLQRSMKARLSPVYILKQVFDFTRNDNEEKMADALKSLQPKDTAEFLSWLRQALQGTSAGQDNALAWYWATSGDGQGRNGPGAVMCAEQAVVKTRRKNPGILDTLAAAYAETGQFDKAVSTENEAIALLTRPKDIEDYRSQLKLYEAKTPYHQPVERHTP